MVRRVGWSGCGSSPTVLPSRMGVIIERQKRVTFESKLTACALAMKNRELHSVQFLSDAGQTQRVTVHLQTLA